MESTRAIFQILEYILGVTESINYDLIYWGYKHPWFICYSKTCL